MDNANWNRGRLDEHVAARLKVEYGEALAIIRIGHVAVNRKATREPGLILKGGDTIWVGTNFYTDADEWSVV